MSNLPQTCHMHSEFKGFCQLENRRGGSEHGRGKEVEANWAACFLRPPLTAHCGWLCLFLSFSFFATTSLTLCDYLFPGRRREKMGERERRRERKRLVSTAMADERKRDRFCLVAHLSSLSLSLSFPLFHSVIRQIHQCSLFLLKHIAVPLSRFHPSFTLAQSPEHPFFLFQSALNLLPSRLTDIHVCF